MVVSCICGAPVGPSAENFPFVRLNGFLSSGTMRRMMALPTEVAQFIHPHPTLVEAIGEAHLAAAGRPLHG